MIQRMVFIKFAESHATPEIREAVAREARALFPTFTGVHEARIGVPADDDALVWDLCISVRCPNLDAVTAYLADPQHRQWVDDVLRPRAEVIKRWNFDLGAV